jgi:hypothetical protein
MTFAIEDMQIDKKKKSNLFSKRSDNRFSTVNNNKSNNSYNSKILNTSKNMYEKILESLYTNPAELM